MDSGVFGATNNVSFLGSGGPSPQKIGVLISASFLGPDGPAPVKDGVILRIPPALVEPGGNVVILCFVTMVWVTFFGISHPGAFRDGFLTGKVDLDAWGNSLSYIRN